jgi:hypothetical protein
MKIHWQSKYEYQLNKYRSGYPLFMTFWLSNDRHLQLLRVQPKHQKVNESIRAIRSQGLRLLGPAGSKATQSAKAKLIALYQTTQRQCESEHSTLEQLLMNIQVGTFF